MRANRASLAVLGGLAMCLGLLSVTTAQEEPAPVSFVSGTVVEVYGHTFTEASVPTDVRGYEVTVGTSQPTLMRQVVEWSDPRLPTTHWVSGDYTLIWKPSYEDMDGAMNTVTRSLLEDEEGRWRGTGRWVNDGRERFSFYVLTGEGAYEGLYALLHGVTPADAEGPWDLAYEGYIFEAEMLPFPDEPVPATTEGYRLYPFPTGPPTE
jgi:hypothetical protein